MRKGLIALFLGIFAVFASAQINDLSDAPPNGVLPGPFGRPLQVLADGGYWSTPLKVYTDREASYYVPDITQPGWVQWNIDGFRQTGEYSVPFYMYREKTRETVNYYLVVDTRNHAAVLNHWLVGPVAKINFSKASTGISLAVFKTTALVEEEMARYKGQSIQEALDQQRIVVSRMVGGSSPIPSVVPNNSAPDLNSLGGPDLNPLLATNEPCQPRSTDQISPPIILSSPADAQYSDAARRAKITGKVVLCATVNPQGILTDIQVKKPLGYGLDEQAVLNAKQYRFRPAIDRSTGQAVPYTITVEVNFRLY